MTELICAKRLQLIVNYSNTLQTQYLGYTHARAKRWEKNGKSRTYFYIEKSKCGKYYEKKDYGYFDNVKKEYFPGDYDLRKNITFWGEEFSGEIKPETEIEQKLTQRGFTADELQKYLNYYVFG